VDGKVGNRDVSEPFQVRSKWSSDEECGGALLSGKKIKSERGGGLLRSNSLGRAFNPEKRQERKKEGAS